MIKKELTAAEAKEKALRLLEFRSYSEKELCEKLRRCGAKSEFLPPIMEFLKEYDLIDDEKYAMRLAHDLQKVKKYGKFRITAELKARGIEGEALENALSELDDDEEEALLPLVEKKLGGDFERKNIEKAIRYFAYRGYSFDDIKKCIDIIKSEQI